jgi:phenylacetate-CoA ligase
MFQPELEAMAVEERRALQDRRLRDLVARLRVTPSEYWRDKLRGVEARGLDEIGALPFTAKSELRDAYPFGSLAVSLDETVRVHASSGTRGKPLVVAYTAADVSVFADVNARAIACAGGRPSDVLHVAYGYGLFTGGLGLHHGGERLGATVVPASGGNPGLQIELLADLGADGLACTPSFALLLAERAAADGLADRIRLRYGIFGAEPWSEAMREKLERAWGIDACDLYGLSEVIGPGVAAECREGKGGLHVFDDHFFPEIVDPASREQLPPGELGELVVTTLTKDAFPVLRYRTGDLTSIVTEPCTCGRTHPRIARLTGRVDDMLVVRGINVFPGEIEAVVLSDPSLGGHYAIVVDRRRALPELEVHVELAEGSALSETTEDRLAERLEERLRLRVRIVVYPPGGLPRQEGGKAKRVFERTHDGDPFAG